jgi:hypothetical protein
MFIQKPCVPSRRSLVTHSVCVKLFSNSLSVAGLVKWSAHVHVP